jgi:uncharacterized protein (TIGR02271 family)
MTRTGLPLLDAMTRWQGIMLDQWSATIDALVPAARAPNARFSRLHRMPSDANEEVIPLAEETLEVSKQEISTGQTKIHRVVLERPVSEDVTLVSRTVTIQRRKPRQVLASGDVLSEHTLEVNDTKEVPVVRKGVRLVEEVVVRREETRATETVHATLKRNDVRIEAPSRQIIPAPNVLPVNAHALPETPAKNA